MKTRVQVEGLRELDAALGELKKSTAKGVLRRTGRQALEPFDQAWRSLAPHLTGALERSGAVGSKLSRSQRAEAERDSFVEVFAGPGPLPQAIIQEFGSSTNHPQPFMRPAWDRTKDQVLQRVKQFLGDEIQKTAARAAKRAAKAASRSGG